MSDSAGVSAAVRDRGPGRGPTAAADHGGGGRSSRVWLAATAGMLVACTVALFLPLRPEAVGVVVVVLSLLLIFLRMPVAAAMALPSLIGLYKVGGISFVTSSMTSVPYPTLASWTLSVVPMFVLLGMLMWKSGMTEQLFVAGKHWLGWMPGGLAVGTNLAGTGLAAVSGSSLGTTYALGRAGIPEMLKAGYDKRLAIGAVMVAGLPGQLIPPSVLLIIYSGIAGSDIGQQLLAGVGPGVLVSACFTVMIILLARRWAPVRPVAETGAAQVTWGERLKSLLVVWPVPLIMLVVIYGMFSGMLTATEAGSAAACLAVMAAVVRRGWRAWHAIAQAAILTVSTVGAVFIMLIGLELLNRVFALTHLGTSFADLVNDMGLNRIGFLLMMTLVYTLLGTFMESLPMMVLTIPVLLPTLHALDIPLIWFGVFAVFMGELAVLTPPVGMLAFVLHNIVRDPEVNRGQNISLMDVFNTIWWYYPMAMAIVILLIFFPEIATWLPDLASTR